MIFRYTNLLRYHKVNNKISNKISNGGTCVAMKKKKEEKFIIIKGAVLCSLGIIVQFGAVMVQNYIVFRQAAGPSRVYPCMPFLQTGHYQLA